MYVNSLSFYSFVRTFYSICFITSELTDFWNCEFEDNDFLMISIYFLRVKTSWWIDVLFGSSY